MLSFEVFLLLMELIVVCLSETVALASRKYEDWKGMNVKNI